MTVWCVGCVGGVSRRAGAYSVGTIRCVCWRVAGRDRYERCWRRQRELSEKLDQQTRCARIVQSLQVEQPGTRVSTS